ncbi:MAG: tyrosine-type recombinase/integrase, partial [Desulfobacterales bacterium]
NGFLKWQAKQNPEYHSPLNARGDLIKYSSPCYAQSEQFDTLLEKFGNHLRAGKTRAAYLPAIRNFFSVCGKNPEAISLDDIQKWKDFLNQRNRERWGRNISDRTVANHLSAIAKFNRFLKADGKQHIRGIDLDSEFVRPRLSSRREKPIQLDPDEVKSLLDEITKAKTKIAVRDHALFSLIFCCALRVGEAVNMKTGHILFFPSRAVVQIHGRKRKRSETQDLTFEDRADLKYLKSVRQWMDLAKTGEEEPLFCPCLWDRKNREHVIRPGTGIEEREMQKRFRLWADKAGIRKMDRRRVIHSLRHTRAADLLKNRKWDIVEVREFLGHANIATTDVYLH